MFEATRRDPYPDFATAREQTPVARQESTFEGDLLFRSPTALPVRWD